MVLGALATIAALFVALKAYELAQVATEQARERPQVTLLVTGASDLDFQSDSGDEGGFSPALSRALLLVNTGQAPVYIVGVEVLSFPVMMVGPPGRTGYWELDYVRAVAADPDYSDAHGVWMSSTEGCRGAGSVAVLPGQAVPFVALMRPPELMTELGNYTIMPDRSTWNVRVTLADGAQMKMTVDPDVVREVRASLQPELDAIRTACGQPGKPVRIVESLARPTN